MRHSFPLAFIVAIFVYLLVPFSAFARCGDGGGITSNILFQCRTFDQVLEGLPCGITNISDPNCGSFQNGDGECWFDIGHPLGSGHILFEWLKDADTGQTPSSQTCTRVKINVQDSFCGTNSIPFFRQCPDPLASDDDYCFPNCEQIHPSTPPEVELLWDDPCRAYALMPSGWRRDQLNISATAFFTVGRHFPVDALGRDGHENSPYSATQAFLEHQLGPTMLGAVGFSPLWGDPDNGGRLPNEPKAFASVDLCVDVIGALLASPRWQTNLAGVRQFPLLSSQCGINVYGADSSLLEGSPASRGHVLPRLRQWAASHRHELVCVTREIADERRHARLRPHRR